MGLRASAAWLAGSEAWLAGSEACLAGSEAWLAGSEACLAGCWALEGGDVRTDVRTYVRTYGRTENLPILQDFVPYRGRCPKSIHSEPLTYRHLHSLTLSLKKVKTFSFLYFLE